MTSSPGFDIIATSARELGQRVIAPHSVKRPGQWVLSVDVDAIMAAVQPDTSAIFLVSPDNPTGSVLSADDLRRVSEFAAERDITLVVDQCFALISRELDRVPLLSAYASHGSKWAMLWDTGKTFGLNDDKLGCIFASEALAPLVRSKLDALQPNVPLRSLEFFDALMRRAAVQQIYEIGPQDEWNLRRGNRDIPTNYYGHLSRIVQNNLGVLRVAMMDVPMSPMWPDAGSVTMVTIRSFGAEVDGRKLRQVAADLGLTMTSGDAFVMSPEDETPGNTYFVRLALARDFPVMEQAAGRLQGLAVLANMGVRIDLPGGLAPN